MPRLLLVILFFLHTGAINAQSVFPRNTFYIEAGGAGTHGSISYERQLTANPGFGARVGIGFLLESGTYLSLPLGINYLLPVKKENHYIDVGLNVTPLIKLRSSATGDLPDRVFVIPAVGYRIHSKKNVFFRVSLAVAATHNHFTPWAGIAIGNVF